MELKAFVEQTLVQIVDGVAAAAATVKAMNNGARVNPVANAMGGGRDTKVEFDVALARDGSIAPAGDDAEGTTRVRFEVVVTHPSQPGIAAPPGQQDHCWMTPG